MSVAGSIEAGDCREKSAVAALAVVDSIMWGNGGVDLAFVTA